ncbi:hypothetical protein ACSTLF_00060, partial [Vibrio parahaemolyticus]
AKSAEEIIEEFGGIELTEMELSGNYRSTQRIIDYYRNFQTEAIDIKSQCPYSEERGILSLNNSIQKDQLIENIASIVEDCIANGI